MERHGEEIHVDETEASGGVKKHGVRYVLLISLVLAIGVLSLIWITGALTSTDDAGSYDDTRAAGGIGGRRDLDHRRSNHRAADGRHCRCACRRGGLTGRDNLAVTIPGQPR
ncbi:MAG: hypothetical protein R3D89_09890 [Sphingomonadaceae bacterium]